MPESILVNKTAILDLVRIKEEFDAVIESLELMSDQEFMKSYQEAKKQVSERTFENWNEL